VQGLDICSEWTHSVFFEDSLADSPDHQQMCESILTVCKHARFLLPCYSQLSKEAPQHPWVDKLGFTYATWIDTCLQADCEIMHQIWDPCTQFHFVIVVAGYSLDHPKQTLSAQQKVAGDISQFVCHVETHFARLAVINSFLGSASPPETLMLTSSPTPDSNSTFCAAMFSIGTSTHPTSFACLAHHKAEHKCTCGWPRSIPTGLWTYRIHT